MYIYIYISSIEWSRIGLARCTCNPAGCFINRSSLLPILLANCEKRLEAQHNTANAGDYSPRQRAGEAGGCIFNRRRSPSGALCMHISYGVLAIAHSHPRCLDGAAGDKKAAIMHMQLAGFALLEIMYGAAFIGERRLVGSLLYFASMLLLHASQGGSFFYNIHIICLICDSLMPI